VAGPAADPDLPAATFAPAFFYKVQPMTLHGLLPWQKYMLQLQDSVVKPHTYMSRWWQWMFNLRPIWFLYEKVDGAQRGVLMLGNPFTMLAGLPALLFCLWDGLRGNRLRAGLFALYFLSLVFWAVNGKPVQFYYHYMLASLFLTAALAVVLADWWDLGVRWPGRVALLLAVGLFIGFYPILSAAGCRRRTPIPPIPGCTAGADRSGCRRPQVAACSAGFGGGGADGRGRAMRPRRRPGSGSGAPLRARHRCPPR
jgi:hypothetical protein